MALYRDFRTPEELDREYNPRLAVPNVDDEFKRWAEDSARARGALPGARLDVRYGPTRAEYLDLFPAEKAGAPVHVFFHGGYWRAFTAKEFSFVAEPLRRRGVTTAVVNYALCPEVTVEEIVRQCRAALAWVHRNAASFGGDPARISISGHSAGGHIVGMMLATEWERLYGLPADLVKTACPISGLYDLEPFPFTWLQPTLQLGWDQVRRCSPLRHLPSAAPGPRVAVVVGGRESAEFHRQAESYVAALAAAGHAPRYLDVEDRDHFTILHDLRGAGGGPLFDAILDAVGG
jgi:arylformamidase